MYPKCCVYCSPICTQYKHKMPVHPNTHRAGNEPDLLAVYLFCYAGRADLTQKVNCEHYQISSHQHFIQQTSAQYNMSACITAHCLQSHSIRR